jgi:hypothetical protein
VAASWVAALREGTAPPRSVVSGDGARVTTAQKRGVVADARTSSAWPGRCNPGAPP